MLSPTRDAVVFCSDQFRDTEIRDVATGRLIWGPTPKYARVQQWSKAMSLLTYDSVFHLLDGRSEHEIPIPVRSGIAPSFCETAPLLAYFERIPAGERPFDPYRLRVWNYRTGREEWQWSHRKWSWPNPSTLVTPRWSPDGRWLVVHECEPESNYHVFSQTGDHVAEGKVDLEMAEFVWSPDSKRLALRVRDGVEIVTLPDGEGQKVRHGL
ncbi:hypothetical protein EON80_25290 [bacterium]|nr:MAG: hypothetical protein EON80_25290 [bacterium]